MKFSKRKMMAIAAASMVALAPMTAKADKNGVSIKSDSLFQLAQYNFYAFKGVYGDRLFYTRLYKNGSMEEIEKFFRDPDNLDLCETSQQEDVRSWRFQCREKESDQADPSRGAEPERPEVSGQLRNSRLILEFVERCRLLLIEIMNAEARAGTESYESIREELEKVSKKIAEKQKTTKTPLTEEYISAKLCEANERVAKAIKEGDDLVRRSAGAFEERESWVNLLHGEVEISPKTVVPEAVEDMRAEMENVKSLCGKVELEFMHAILVESEINRLTAELTEIKKREEEIVSRTNKAVREAEQQLNVEGILAAIKMRTDVKIKKIELELALRLVKIDAREVEAELRQKKLDLGIAVRSAYAKLRRNPILSRVYCVNKGHAVDEFFSYPGSMLVAIPSESGYSFECYGVEEWCSISQKQKDEWEDQGYLFGEEALLKFAGQELRMW